ALTDLCQRRQWVCWREEERTDKSGQMKSTKVPYNARTGRLAESDQPETWSSYEQAKHAYERSQKSRRPYQGLGYMFHDDVIGIDLDHCVKPDGTLDEWAQAYVNRLSSYAEYSPNDGIHALVRGNLPDRAWHRRKIKGARHKEAAIEMYSSGRYFTMTG